MPVNVVLKVAEEGGVLRALLTLPESRQHNLELPSPYSDSARVTYENGRLRLVFTPDIGFGFIYNLDLPPKQARIVLDVAPHREHGLSRIRASTRVHSGARPEAEGYHQVRGIGHLPAASVDQRDCVLPFHLR
jgi:hypothetical protein